MIHSQSPLTYPVWYDAVLRNGQHTRYQVSILEPRMIALEYPSHRKGVHGLIRDVSGNVALEVWSLHTVAHVGIEPNGVSLDDHTAGWRRERDLLVFQDHVHVRLHGAHGHLLVDKRLAGNGVGGHVEVPKCEGNILDGENEI